MDQAALPQSDTTGASLDTAGSIAVALLVALVLRIVVVQPFTIPSASMQPALLTGDYVLVTKYDYGWSRHSVPFSPPLPRGRLLERVPRRGDLVVFQLPRDPAVAYVKRIVALPGDTVRLTGGTVFVNGRALPRAAAVWARDPDGGATVMQYRESQPGGASYLTFDRGPGRPGDDTAAWRVPAGRYFVLGDNRDNSIDSRWPEAVGVGLVPADNLVGRAVMVLASWREGVSLFRPWTWVTHLRPDRLARPL